MKTIHTLLFFFLFLNLYSQSTEPLYINEFMARNDSTIMDEFGEYDDWIEIYNGGSTSLYLGDKYMTDNLEIPLKWQMPNQNIEPGEFIIVWADDQVNQGPWHASFKLSGDGEEIGIFTANSEAIDTVVYDSMGIDEAIGRLPNGTGDFQDLEPTPGSSNQPLSAYQPLSNSIKLAFSPNPSFGSISIAVENSKALEFKIDIKDLMGTAVWKINLNKSQNFELDVNLNDIPSGIYFLTIHLEDGSTKTERLIIQ